MERFRAAHSVFLRVARHPRLAAGNTLASVVCSKRNVALYACCASYASGIAHGRRERRCRGCRGVGAAIRAATASAAIPMDVDASLALVEAAALSLAASVRAL